MFLVQEKLPQVMSQSVALSQRTSPAQADWPHLSLQDPVPQITLLQAPLPLQSTLVSVEGVASIFWQALAPLQATVHLPLPQRIVPPQDDTPLQVTPQSLAPVQSMPPPQEPCPQLTLQEPPPQRMLWVHEPPAPQSTSQAVALVQSTWPVQDLALQMVLQARPAGQVHPVEQSISQTLPAQVG